MLRKKYCYTIVIIKNILKKEVFTVQSLLISIMASVMLISTGYSQENELIKDETIPDVAVEAEKVVEPANETAPQTPVEPVEQETPQAPVEPVEQEEQVTSIKTVKGQVDIDSGYNCLMTPYPSDYAYLPEKYDKQAILNWYDSLSMSHEDKMFILEEKYGCMGAIDIGEYITKQDVVDAVEYIVDNGYNPWFSASVREVTVLNDALTYGTLYNTAPFSKEVLYGGHAGGYVNGLEWTAFAMTEPDNKKLHGNVRTKYAETVPQDIADACHQGK
ncbi:MAG: hypothetical protein RSC41_05100 [Oscillospiraceae bacterium]